MISIRHDLAYMPTGWTGHLVGTADTVSALETIHQAQSFQSILEFGFNAGWSAALFLTLFPKIKITSIEIYRNKSAEQGVLELQKRFPDQHSIIWADSTQLGTGDLAGTRYDTAFIDGGHDPDTVSADIDLARSLGIRNYIFDDGNHPNVMPGIARHPELRCISKNPYSVVRYKAGRYREKRRTSSLDHYCIN